LFYLNPVRCPCVNLKLASVLGAAKVFDVRLSTWTVLEATMATGVSFPAFGVVNNKL